MTEPELTMDRDAMQWAAAAGWRTLLANRTFQNALLATAGLMETQRITPQCRSSRTADGAWEEAVRRLREIYDAQVEHDPTITLGLSLGRVIQPETATAPTPPKTTAAADQRRREERA